MPKFRNAAAAANTMVSLWFAVSGAHAQAQQTPMDQMPGMASSFYGEPKAEIASGTGTVVAINAAQRKITLDYDPIQAMGWPAMKMEFATGASVDLRLIKIGSRVNFIFGGPKGSYTVQSIRPAQ